MRQSVHNLIKQGNIMSGIQILKLPEVVKLTKLSRASIYRLIAIGDFPKQFKLAKRSSAWLLEEVNGWLSSKVSNRDGGINNGSS